ALAQGVVLLEQTGDAADRRAEDDPDTRRVEAVQARVVERLAPGCDAEEHVALELPRFLRRDDRRRVESLHLAGDPDGQSIGVEGADPPDAALDRAGRAPCLLGVEAE